MADGLPSPSAGAGAAASQSVTGDRGHRWSRLTRRAISLLFVFAAFGQGDTNAQIYGADIDTNVLFRDDRISTFHVDQTSPQSIAGLWEAVGPEASDLMIDDGLHTFDAGICLFENSFRMLRPSGVYTSQQTD